MRHIFLPKFHGLPDNIWIEARSLQVCGCAQPVRTCTNNDNFLGFHSPVQT